MPENSPLILMDSFAAGRFRRSWRFDGYLATLETMEHEELPGLLEQIEKAAEEGLFAVGFVSYEAATSLNPDLPRLPQEEGLPLAWFALFRQRREVSVGQDLPHPEDKPSPLLSPDLGSEQYRLDLERILEHIANGDCYQANYTFPLEGLFSGEPLRLYSRIIQGQQPPFGAYLDTGRFVIMSASPELFFSRAGDSITVRPMKGTAPRGRWSGEDRELASILVASEKERAENLMIVDLLRNDLGIIARTGTVSVDALFQVESYPTVHQLTSTISASLKEGTTLAAVFRALFPCGSITGAPKKRSMEIIAGLENSPRGVYCGAIGCVAPGGEATFSVAIRTLVLDRSNTRLSLRIGSGVTWSSNPDEEYRECLGKAAFLSAHDKPFVLIETMRLVNGIIQRMKRHLTRMAESARYFGFPFEAAEAAEALIAVCAAGSKPLRIRLTLDRGGELAVTTALLENEREPLRLTFARGRVDSRDRFRYHKTSHRELLDQERQLAKGFDEVLFMNERGEMTEGSYNNLLLKIGNRLVTPTLSSGLLPGVMRAELLESGTIAQEILCPADLARADEIWLMNSLRGLRRAEFIEDTKELK